jgi:beta-glucosidase
MLVVAFTATATAQDVLCPDNRLALCLRDCDLGDEASCATACDEACDSVRMVCPHSFYASNITDGTRVCTRFYQQGSQYFEERFYPQLYAEEIDGRTWENRPGCSEGQLVCPYYGNASLPMSDPANVFAGCANTYDECNLPPFMNHRLTVEQRLEDLLERFTLKEKIKQLYTGWDDRNSGNNRRRLQGFEDGRDQPDNEVPRMGIPRYWWLNEGLHGMARFNADDNGTPLIEGSTSFPQVIGLGSSFHPQLWRDIGEAEATEYRAVQNDAIKHSVPHAHRNLNVYAPNMNVLRDPRWGRGQEVPSEDPFLNALYSVEFVKGLQTKVNSTEGYQTEEDEQIEYFTTVANCKHFAAYSLEETEDGVQRDAYDSVADDLDMRETYLRAFEACVTQANVQSVMSGYNAINGVPTSSDPWLLNYLLREEWGFEGFVVSDFGAISSIITEFDFQPPDGTHPVAYTINSGCDQDGGDYIYDLMMEDLVEAGEVTVERIDEAVGRLFKSRFELGLFDPPDANPLNAVPPTAARSEENTALTKKAALESMVLMKNENVAGGGKVLPLSIASLGSKVAVLGPNADNAYALLGNYAQYFLPESEYFTPWESLEARLAEENVELVLETGCLSIDCERPGEPEIDVVDVAMDGADTVILVVGLHALQHVGNICDNRPPFAPPDEEDQYIGYCEGEGTGGDRLPGLGIKNGLGFPPSQQQLVDHVVASVEGTDTTLVIVLVNGSPLIINDLMESENVGAILEAWYPNEQGGEAVVDILFGDYNPAGRLPLTWPVDESQLPDYGDMSMAGRTYRYLPTEPEFEPMKPFGFGLSYTEFAYSNLVLEEAEVGTCDGVTFTVDVTNTGLVDGDEVVQAYAYGFTGARSPEKTLVAFDRVNVLAGETVTVPLHIDFRQLSIGADTPDQPEIHGAWVVRPGTFTLNVGGGQPKYVDTVTAEFEITGDAINMLDCIFDSNLPVPRLPPFDDDDDDTVLIIGSVVGAAAGLALVAGGYALYSKQGSAEKEEPLLGQEKA